MSSVILALHKEFSQHI